MFIFSKKKSEKISSKKRQKGLSLIEASMVLALSAIVVAGVMVYYQSASDNNKLQEADSELMSAIGEISTLYAGSNDFSGLNTEILAKTSAIPSNMVLKGKGKDPTDTILNPYGGNLTVAPVADPAQDYTLTMDKIPVSGCVGLASSEVGSNLVVLTINGTKVDVRGPAEATKDCNKDGSNGDLNTLVWTLKN